MYIRYTAGKCWRNFPLLLHLQWECFFYKHILVKINQMFYFPCTPCPCFNVPVKILYFLWNMSPSLSRTSFASSICNVQFSTSMSRLVFMCMQRRGSIFLSHSGWHNRTHSFCPIIPFLGLPKASNSAGTTVVQLHPSLQYGQHSQVPLHPVGEVLGEQECVHHPRGLWSSGGWAQTSLRTDWTLPRRTSTRETYVDMVWRSYHSCKFGIWI